MDLPPNWTKYSTDDGKEYFHNSVTQVTQWDKPEWQAHEDALYNPSLAELNIQEKNAGATGPFDVDVGMADLGGGKNSIDQGTASLRDNDGVSGTMEPQSSGSNADGKSNMLFPGLPKFCFCLDLNYLQTFFDVSTEDVTKRIKLALIPASKASDENVQEFRGKPDFWGPFWICTTVVIFLAATGNFGQTLASTAEESRATDWELVSSAAGMVYGCLVGVPLLTHGILYMTGPEAKFNLHHLICVYGYSFIPLIPISILMLIPSTAFKWILAILGIMMSCLFLRNFLWNDISVADPRVKGALIVLLFGAHLTIYLVYRIHFFTSNETKVMV